MVSNLLLFTYAGGESPDFKEILDDDYVVEGSEQKEQVLPEKIHPSSSRYSLSGIGQVSLRHSETQDDKTAQTLRGQIRLNGWIGLGENNCLKLQARLSTGKKFNSEAFETGAWDGDADFNLALRRLYVDFNCIQNSIRLQLGSVPSDNVGRLGLSSSGWVSGARLVLEDPEHERKIVLLFGNLGNLENPGVFQRDDWTANYAQIEGLQILNGGHEVYVHLSTYEDNIYSRAGLKWAIQKYIEWLQNVRGEVLYLNSKNMGYYLGAEVAIEKWRINAYAIYLNPILETTARATLILNSFYGLGRNVYLELTRPIDEKWTLYIRTRQGEASSRTEAGVNRKF